MDWGGGTCARRPKPDGREVQERLTTAIGIVWEPVLEEGYEIRIGQELLGYWDHNNPHAPVEPGPVRGVESGGPAEEGCGPGEPAR